MIGMWEMEHERKGLGWWIVGRVVWDVLSRGEMCNMFGRMGLYLMFEMEGTGIDDRVFPLKTIDEV